MASSLYMKAKMNLTSYNIFKSLALGYGKECLIFLVWLEMEILCVFQCASKIMNNKSLSQLYVLHLPILSLSTITATHSLHHQIYFHFYFYYMYSYISHILFQFLFMHVSPKIFASFPTHCTSSIICVVQFPQFPLSNGSPGQGSASLAINSACCLAPHTLISRTCDASISQSRPLK